MKSVRIGVVIALVLVVGLATFATIGARADDEEADWVAILSGANEVPARDTLARGVALFFMNDDGSLGYKLVVANINNVVASHIHCGAAGVAGPVGVNLFIGGTPGGGRFSGVLATGTITAPNAGNACGWTTLADVIGAMNGGDTYVNVHTNDGVDPPNTGPGDFPGGEIRGQIMPAD